MRLLVAVLLGMAVVFAHAAGDAAAGKKAFAKCSSCHAMGPSAHSGFGPQLHGIIGRPAAGAADFNYSQAMRKAGFVWTEDKLRAFLKAPNEVVPDNKMRFWGIANERELDDLLAYLRSLQ